MKRILRITFITIFILTVASGNGFYGQSFRKVWVNNLRTRYGVSDKGLFCYSSNGNQVMNPDGKPIFVCPRDFRIMDYDIAGDGEGIIVGILMSRKSSVYLEVFHAATGSVLVLKDMSPYQPWKICFADVDNDSVMEVCLGVYKRTPLHNLPAKRLFIYNYQHGLQPKWLGSRLAHPFTDFGFAENGKTSILCALELRADRLYSINSYVWDSFGFTGTGRTSDAIAGECSLAQGYVATGGVYYKRLFIINPSENNAVEVSVQ